MAWGCGVDFIIFLGAAFDPNMRCGAGIIFAIFYASSYNAERMASLWRGAQPCWICGVIHHRGRFSHDPSIRKSLGLSNCLKPIVFCGASDWRFRLGPPYSKNCFLHRLSSHDWHPVRRPRPFRPLPAIPFPFDPCCLFDRQACLPAG